MTYSQPLTFCNFLHYYKGGCLHFAGLKPAVVHIAQRLPGFQKMVWGVRSLEKMKQFIIYILIRLLDLHSTYLCISKYGVSVEGNSLVRNAMNDYSMFAVINFFISILLYLLIIKIKRLGLIVVRIFMVINALVVISNYIMYLVAWGVI